MRSRLSGWIAFAASLQVAKAEWESAYSVCPRECGSAGSSSEWTAMHDNMHLLNCERPLLLDFNWHTPVDSSSHPTSIFACVGTPSGENKTAPGINSGHKKTPVIVESRWYGEPSANSKRQASLVSAGQSAANWLMLEKESDKTKKHSDGVAAFGYDKGAVFGVYVGDLVHTQSAADLIDRLIDQIHHDPKGHLSLKQVCGNELGAGKTIGVVAAGTDEYGGRTTLGQIQRAIQTWSQGDCVVSHDGQAMSSSSEPTHVHLTTKKSPKTPRSLLRRNECSDIQVKSGDSCGALASECGISGSDFTKYNPAPDLCAKLSPGQWVCCTAGDLPDHRPKQNSDGNCVSHLVKSGESCSSLGAANGLTNDEIEDFNKDTWGWYSCDKLLASANICLSTGSPPMPAPLDNAVCGPQKPDTEQPTDGTKLADLNPCPLNACCNIWGQCGITTDFCTDTAEDGAAPGTAKEGTNGCISNCGTEIVKGGVPGAWITLGYFEAWNADRKCLNMDVRTLAASTQYTHIHFAFGKITSDFKIDVSEVQEEFDHFKTMTGFKKIISFGGWSFSTSGDSYPIFRDSVTSGQREAFAQEVANFVSDNGLDGADFDWEYPSAPDIPGIPAGSKEDGPNYLDFLKTLRGTMGDKSISIAAPASYWYLKGFPIKDMSEVIDYIVYMTYDLHGQWDYGSPWSNPGCDKGNCLRSHVNSTETDLSLAMITKAGVPSGKVVVGVSSYGRSFGIADPGCTGPDCLFTGPDSGATPGACTETAGYISNAELSDILKGVKTSKRDGGAISWYDDDTQSDMMTYDGNWVAYMSDDTMHARVSTYKGYNMAGSTNWAVDLQEHHAKYGSADPDSGLAPGITCKQLSGYYDSITKSQGGKIRAMESKDWDAVGASDYLQRYYEKNKNSGTFFSDYATVLGVGQSLGGCTVQNGCERPDCTALGDLQDQEDSAAAYMVLVAMTNHLQLFSNMWKDIHEVIHQFDDNSASFTEKFDASDVSKTVPQSTIVKDISACITGGLTTLTILAELDPIVIGISVFIGIIGTIFNSVVPSEAPSYPLDDLANVQRRVNESMVPVRDEVENLFIGLHKDGNYKELNLPETLAHGNFLDFRNIPYLNADLISDGERQKMLLTHLNAAMLNYAWRRNRVWIQAFEMTEEDCKLRYPYLYG